MIQSKEIKQPIEKIHTRQLISLGFLYASILIGWIAYYKYQPRLLAEFGLSDFLFPLIIIQGIILAITPPLAGMMGDRLRERNGHRLPVISAGISFAAMIFMAVAFSLILQPSAAFIWILPVLIVLWLFSMSIFTSPAISTVELFAPQHRLPRAVAILAIVGNLIYALEPVIADVIDFLGAPLTFIAGGAAVFLSGYALKNNAINLFKLTGTKEHTSGNHAEKSSYAGILFLGLLLGLVTGFILNSMPDLLDEKLAGFLGMNISGTTMVSALLVITALLSLPASNIARDLGLEKSVWISFVLALALICIILTSGLVWMVSIAAVCYAATFALISVSALPLAISRASLKQKVFCVGIFFAGVEIPNSIMDAVEAYFLR
ncbi:MAG TPA: hypothetical protein PKC24_06700 [Cyclobacteriaceae bacterium]|nr:hypothetical protein [Cyclobacteriaceae bacterium]